MSLNLQESPLVNLLGQTSSLPWQLVGISSYESIISYCNSHYPPSVILAKDAGAELIVKLLKISAGFGASSDGHIHLVSRLVLKHFCAALGFCKVLLVYIMEYGKSSRCDFFFPNWF